MTRDSGEPGEGSRGFAGSWSHVRPTLDDPMSWSIPVLRVAGIGVRLHLLFLLFAAGRLLEAAWPAASAGSFRFGFTLTALSLAILFGIVLLHEFGHCIACRRTGGSADEVLLWPLGGLAFCSPSPHWQAYLWTAIGGPLVNVLILAVTIPTLGFITGDWLGTALPSPFSIALSTRIAERWDLLALFLLNWTALVLLLFNLLPLFPLDGGRILQAALWPRLGYSPAMRIACRVGYVGAIGLGLLGILQGSITLVLIALFGGLTCWRTLKELAFTDGELSAEDQVIRASREADEAAAAGERRERLKAITRQEDEERQRRGQEAEFDRILDKIRTSGIASLTAAERKALERETERRRQES